MSLSHPSQVSATTGSDHQSSSGPAGPCATRHAITASRTTPTLCVLVIMTGPSRKPDSSTQWVPVISPLPFCEYQPANEKRSIDAVPRGSTAVTPVRIGPLPTTSLPLPSMSVVCPTRTPSTSVMAFKGAGVPSKGTPRSRARTLCAASAPLATPPVSDARSTSTGRATDERVISGYSGERSLQAGSGPCGHHHATPGVPPVHRVHEHTGGAHIERLQ